MVPTFSLVAATLLLGQTAESQPQGVTAPPGAKIYVYSGGVLVPYTEAQKPALGARGPSDNRPVLSKIQGWFGKRNDGTSQATTLPPGAISGTEPTRIIIAPMMPPAQTPAPAATPAELPKKMPATSQGEPAKAQVIVLQKGESPNPAPANKVVQGGKKSPILSANAERIGRDDKFEWVTGQLEIENGQHVLYYATPETQDPYRGRMVLSPQKVNLQGFRGGDLISVHGELHVYRGTPTYNLVSADLIERPKR
jgi:hypothetical protein